MPTNNIIANLFTTLFNTEDRRKNNSVVIPTSTWDGSTQNFKE